MTASILRRRSRLNSAWSPHSCDSVAHTVTKREATKPSHASSRSPPSKLAMPAALAPSASALPKSSTAHPPVTARRKTTADLHGRIGDEKAPPGALRGAGPRIDLEPS